MRNMSKGIASVCLCLMSAGASAQVVDFDTNALFGGTVPDGTLADSLFDIFGPGG